MLHLFAHQDKDVVEASSRIADLTRRLQAFDASLTDSQSRENKLLKDVEENTRRYREAKHKISQLKGMQVKFNSHFKKNSVIFIETAFPVWLNVFHLIPFISITVAAMPKTVTSIVDFSDISTLGKDYFHYYALFGDSCIKFWVSHFAICCLLLYITSKILYSQGDAGIYLFIYLFNMKIIKANSHLMFCL